MALPTIGVIGAGPVGSKLGSQLLKKGYKVAYGSRSPSSDKVKELLAQQSGATADTVTNVVAASDVLFLATPGAHDDDGIKALAASLGDGVKGKVLLDATNPLSAFPALECRWKQGTSCGEVLAEALPGTHVYKAFNTIAVEHLDHADGSLITGERLTMMFAGAEEKKEMVTKVIGDVGFIPAYVGPIRYARNLEAMAELYIHVSFGPAGLTKEAWGRNFNFQILKKKCQKATVSRFTPAGFTKETQGRECNFQILKM